MITFTASHEEGAVAPTKVLQDAPGVSPTEGAMKPPGGCDNGERKGKERCHKERERGGGGNSYGYMIVFPQLAVGGFNSEVVCV